MNEQEQVENPLRMESAPAPSEPMNALMALRNIRKSRGLTPEDVGTRLKFAPRQIEAFEEGRWEDLPDGIGLRTLAKNYGKLLGVEMSSLEPLLPQHQMRGGSTVNQQHSNGPGLGMAMEQTTTHRSWPWVVVILLVVVVVLGVAAGQGVLPQELIPSWLRGMFE